MSKKGIGVRTVVVAKQESDFLYLSIRAALTKLSKEDLSRIYIFDYEKKAIIISIDGNWEPFIGFTPGYNPKDDRLGLGTGIGVINSIINPLQSRDYHIPGGRIFLNQVVAFHYKSNIQKTLCTFDWAGALPFETVRKIVSDLA